MANTLYGHHLTDEATCLKLIRTSLLREMQLQCRGFEFCPEVTAKLAGWAWRSWKCRCITTPEMPPTARRCAGEMASWRSRFS
jgi:hypothetical protein